MTRSWVRRLGRNRVPTRVGCESRDTVEGTEAPIDTAVTDACCRAHAFDTHFADRIDGETTVPTSHTKLEYSPRLGHVAKLDFAQIGDCDPDFARDGCDLGCCEHLRGTRMGGNTSGKIDRRAKHVAIALEDRPVVQPDAHIWEAALGGQPTNDRLDQCDPGRGVGCRAHDRVTDRLYEDVVRTEVLPRDLTKSSRKVQRNVITVDVSCRSEPREVSKHNRSTRHNAQYATPRYFDMTTVHVVLGGPDGEHQPVVRTS